MRFSWRTWVTAVLMAISMGCGSAAPQVKMLGVTEPSAQVARAEHQDRTLVLFLEVVNPSDLSLRLSRLEYRFQASPWFSTVGEVALSRAVGADSAAVVEVPVRLSAANMSPQGQGQGQGMNGEQQDDVSFSLEGRLFAKAGTVERSWNVKIGGTLHADSLAGSARRAHVRMHLASSTH